MSLSPYFYGNPIGYGLAGFDIIDPGQTLTGSWFCVGPLDSAVTILSGTSINGGTLNNRTLKVSVFGMFDSITVHSASTGSLLCYKAPQ